MTTAIRHHYNLALARHSSGESERILFKAGEATLMGIGLGFISANSKTGLDLGVGKMKAPLDLGLGALMMGGSLFLPLDKDSREVVENMGMVSFGIAMFRKSEAYVKAKAGSSAHGDVDNAFEGDADMGADPILAAARNL